MIGEHGDGPIFFYSADPAVAVFRGNQMALPVESKAIASDLYAIRVAAGKYVLPKNGNRAVRAPLHDCIALEIAEQQVRSASDPYGTFNKPKATMQFFDLRSR